jgi:hypothetical protein
MTGTAADLDGGVADLKVELGPGKFKDAPVSSSGAFRPGRQKPRAGKTGPRCNDDLPAGQHARRHLKTLSQIPG